MTDTKLTPKGPGAKPPERGSAPRSFADTLASLQTTLGAQLSPEEAESFARAVASQRDRDARLDPKHYTAGQLRAREILADRERALEEKRAAEATAAGIAPAAAPAIAPGVPPAAATRRVEELDGTRPDVVRDERRSGEDRRAGADDRRSASPAYGTDRRRGRLPPRLRRQGAPSKAIRDAKRAERIADAESKGAIGFRPEELPIELQAIQHAMERDHTGGRARAAIASWPRRLNAYRKRVLWIACGMEPGNERPADLSDVRSRRIIGYAHSIYLLSRKTTRRGFSHVVKGYSCGALAQLSVNLDTGKPCTPSYVFATSHDAARRLILHKDGEEIPISDEQLLKLPADAIVTGRDECGPMTALRRGHALLFDQPPEHASEPQYLGIPKKRIVQGREVFVRNALNVYWLRRSSRPPS